MGKVRDGSYETFNKKKMFRESVNSFNSSQIIYDEISNIQMNCLLF